MTEAVTGNGRPGANWPRAAEGIQLAGFAVFFLLNTTGILPWSFWFDAIALWPLLIMSAGIRIAFEKSGAPWLVLLGPAVILGGLAWVATGTRPQVEAGPWTPQSAVRAEGTRRLRLDARVAGTQLDVESRALPQGLLADGRATGRHERSRLESTTDGDEARVRLVGGRRDGVVFLPGRKERWDLGLPADLPVRLDVDGIGVRGRLDFSAGRVADGSLRGVFMAFDLRLPKPEQPVTLRLNGVFNALKVSVPAGTSVHVQGAGLPFNAVDRETLGNAGVPGYEIKLEGVFTAVTVETRPAASPAEAPAPPAGVPVPPPPSPRPLPEAPPSPSDRTR
jgi:hypothetical protein